MVRALAYTETFKIVFAFPNMAFNSPILLYRKKKLSE